MLLLRENDRFSVADEASTSHEGLLLFRKYQPSLVSASLEFPDGTGPQMLLQMRKEVPNIRILIYTGTTNRDLILAALEAEPQGVVHKSESLMTLVQGISFVAQNTSYFSPVATSLRIQKHKEARDIAQLLPQELAVLRFIAQGNNLKEVAAQMSRSTKTVETYRKSVMRKLKLKNVAAMVAYAIQCGLVQA